MSHYRHIKQHTKILTGRCEIDFRYSVKHCDEGHVHVEITADDKGKHDTHLVLGPDEAYDLGVALHRAYDYLTGIANNEGK